jgi:hypothetical protein
MTDDHRSPPAPKLPDDYEMPSSIRQVLGQVPPATAFGQERRTELDARLAVMVASELNRATHSVTENLIQLSVKIGGLTAEMTSGAANATTELGALTKALRDGATALNATVETGNRLSRRVWWLNVFVVLLMLVQIWLGWKALPGH